MTLPLRAYWWNGEPNFGDALTPMLLRAFGFEPERAEPGAAEVCVVGSVLQGLGPTFAGAIIGAGFIATGPARTFPQARILALRGPLSAARARVTETVFGDAGLLCPILVEPPRKPAARLGLVPHYRDKDAAPLGRLRDRLGGQLRIIDVQTDPARVLREIADCESILSSSLHGVICADAYGRASGWLVLSDSVIGGGFKFHDYAMSLGVRAQPRSITGNETIDELVAMTERKDFDRNERMGALTAVFEAFRSQVLRGRI
jgi:pyruvyltransferase